MSRLTIALLVLFALPLCAKEYSPPLNDVNKTNLYWGDLHVHSNYSPDSFAFGNSRLTPDNALKFARGIKVTASNGMASTVEVAGDNIQPAEFVFVLGSWGTESYNNRQLTAWLRKRARAGERICGVELGCYIVARAGLLDGKLATTHWSWLNGFKESFDRIDVQETLFTLDSKVMTCSGGLAGIDLMLRLIEELSSSSISGGIADQMLHHPIRNANDPQRSTMGRSTETMLPLVREAMTLIEDNIEEPLTVPQIAKFLDVSQRQLERQFKKHVGCTVVQFGLLRRLQNARLLLISTELSIRQIATASGFNTLSHFAYSFGKFFGRRPSDYREAWPESETAPSWPGSHRASRQGTHDFV